MRLIMEMHYIPMTLCRVLRMPEDYQLVAAILRSCLARSHYLAKDEDSIVVVLPLPDHVPISSLLRVSQTKSMKDERINSSGRYRHLPANE